jgi:hypothetical protein
MAVDERKKIGGGASHCETKRRCIVPTLPDMDNSSFMNEMMASHEWVVDKNESYGIDGILTRNHCSRCGMGRLMILYNLENSQGSASK